MPACPGVAGSDWRRLAEHRAANAEADQAEYPDHDQRKPQVDPNQRQADQNSQQGDTAAATQAEIHQTPHRDYLTLAGAAAPTTRAMGSTPRLRRAFRKRGATERGTAPSPARGPARY